MKYFKRNEIFCLDVQEKCVPWQDVLVVVNVRDRHDGYWPKLWS